MHTLTKHRMATTLLLLLSLGAVAAVVGISRSSEASSTTSPATTERQESITRAYGVFRGDVPTTKDGWAERFTRASENRGEDVDAANIRRAVDTESVAVDVALTSQQLCFHVVASDGGGSVNCRSLDDASTDIAKPLIAVDRTANGMRITLMGADTTTGVTLDGKDGSARVPIRNNVATAESVSDQAELRWVDADGKEQSLTIDRP